MLFVLSEQTGQEVDAHPVPEVLDGIAGYHRRRLGPGGG